ncbi:hypothetical protein [Kitasatospora sp. GP82]|uniref:hypothetical protein n=1 Tax=Kitasatospora sp. GP82 TaxID=3035089 RepID=UPI0024753395|nr:hypothetical protein [Kitasatospora sp. GP82]MDH6125947.1 hypothetical protein [Kitasatospora sp. GP82]
MSNTSTFAPRPRYDCGTCQDWRTVVAPDGKGTVPCPTCRPAEHRTATAAR